MMDSLEVKDVKNDAFFYILLCTLNFGQGK